MTTVLLCLALFTVAAAAVAMAMRNLIHSALLLVASWAGIAAFYLWAGAEFVAFAQLLVYVGAISMVVLFAVLLTRHSRLDFDREPETRGRVRLALFTGGAVCGVLVAAVLGTAPSSVPAAVPSLTVRQLGLALMGPHAASLLAVGVVLTVALLGGVVLAASARHSDPEDAP
ncbi:MAG: NADH-quinone oxidoreductase subunit J [Verrucomicrobia bacterium]|nr:NADH-quinone oxidoreductase subunit J [Verrucomicrobiota bacterium]